MEPIQPEYYNTMNALAKGIDEIFNGEEKGGNRKTGFCLFVFPFGEAEGSRFNYLSNGASRKDMICLMKEMITRFEGQPEISGRA